MARAFQTSFKLPKADDDPTISVHFSESSMLKEIADLIRAIADLMWPMVALVGLLVFRRELRGLFSRLRRGKFFGQELEFSELREAVSIAERRLPERPFVTKDEQKPADRRSISTDILDEASRSPKVSLMRLTGEIQSEVREILASMGWLESVEKQSLPEVIRELDRHGGAPRDLANAVRIFWKIRNQILHGEGDDEEALRAVDFGLTILRMLQGIPRETNIVFHPGVEIYSDPAGKIRREGVAVILETISAGGVIKSRRVFPTTRTHFQKGKRVAWEWNTGQSWDESWYRDPDTNEILYAWTGALEFVGRPLN